MEPRIATLVDQSLYKRLTLDPSILSTAAPAAPWQIEPAAGVEETRSNHDSYSHHDHVDTRNKTPSQGHSSAPLARVLNDPPSSSHPYRPTSGRQTPHHATFHIRNDGPVLGPAAISPDARRRDEHHNSIGYSGSDLSLIQLPKPPQVPRKPTKRPRIPPLLQGLHQPPPLPPKNRLFPPITSERNGLVTDVGDRFGLGSAFPTSNTEDLATARVSPPKGNEVENNDLEPTTAVNFRNGPQEQEVGTESAPDSLSLTQTTHRVQDKAKAPRKRIRWSQKETEDLLTGVSRFGIGRWKQILECTEFHFQGRTAVDLKDRFRVCRPGEGLKARKAATPEGPTTSRSADMGQPNSEIRPLPVGDATAQSIPPAQRTAFDTIDLVDQAATDKTRLHGPFLRSTRRARRAFSDADDRNLLKGFKRHGPVWHSMRDDFELGFGMRHPTDLRDRFRIRYPHLFAQAGFKLKPKEERVLRDEAEEAKAKEAQVSRHSRNTSSKNQNLLAHTGGTTMPNIPPVATLKPLTTPSQAEPARPTFNLITDLTFDDDDDDDDDRSPIILNRNILQWADENSAILPSPPAAPTNTQPATHTASDLLYNPFTASDGLHINPLATLKLPSTAHWGYANPSVSMMAPPPSLPPPAPSKHALPVNGGAGAAASRAHHEMRTPNLPNIVFPYVPSASARNAVHNLPAPADILSSGQTGAADGYDWIG